MPQAVLCLGSSGHCPILGRPGSHSAPGTPGGLIPPPQKGSWGGARSVRPPLLSLHTGGAVLTSRLAPHALRPRVPPSRRPSRLLPVFSCPEQPSSSQRWKCRPFPDSPHHPRTRTRRARGLRCDWHRNHGSPGPCLHPGHVWVAPMGGLSEGCHLPACPERGSCWSRDP